MDRGVRTSQPDRGTRAAERLLAESIKAMGLEESDLGKMKKTDPSKRVIAWILRPRTHVGNRWVSERLVKGHEVSASRSVRLTEDTATPELRTLRRRLEKALRS